MRQSIVATALVLTLVGLFLAGCSKDESPTTPTTDPQKARALVNQANQLFVPKLTILINSGGKDTAGFDMSAANSVYGQALAADPENLDGHFGFAATEIILLYKDPQLRSFFASSSAPLQVVTSALTAHPSANTLLESVIGKGPRSFSSSPLPHSPLDFYQGYVNTDGSVLFSDRQSIIETRLLPVLADAISHFTKITGNPDFAYYIHPEPTDGTPPDSIRIDLTEVYLLLAITQVSNATGSFLVSYNVDYNSGDSAAVRSAWQANSPFLALRPNGAQRMKDTRSNMIGMATSIQNGITFLMNETPHPGIQLITYRPQDAPGLQNAIVMLDSLKSYFTNPQILAGDFNRDGLPEHVTVSLESFFDNAIGDFKAKLPPYTVDVQQAYPGMYVPVLTWQAPVYDAWVFPDPTFNGFFPGMTDVSFKQTFGLASRWSPRWFVWI